MNNLAIIILTYNEQLHIERLLKNIQDISNEIIIVDSFSTDQTKDICLRYTNKFYTNPFVNQAQQLNWALENIHISSKWIFRLDADEYVEEGLKLELRDNLNSLNEDIKGIFVKRKVFFLGKWMKYGGYYPTWILRIWQNGFGKCENRWMDEYMLVEGKTVQFENDIVDHNLNNLTWWTNKHNNYSTREAIEILNTKHHFLQDDNTTVSDLGKNSVKRFLKDRVYNRIPTTLRALLYFMYRYFVLLGFLDGRKGLIWHVLQGFWYRFLIDSKVYQVNYIAETNDKSVKDVLIEDFGLQIK